MDWVRLLACITGTVDEELLSHHEYLVAENRILKSQLVTAVLAHSDNARRAPPGMNILSGYRLLAAQRKPTFYSGVVFWNLSL